MPLVFLIIAVVCAAIYYPGLSSGYYFDDYGQIVMNDALKFSTLNWENLYRAAFSSTAGPLGRQVVMASIAVEMYFLGDGAEHFKWVNLAIHLLNGALLAWLLHMLVSFVSAKSRLSQFGRLWLVLATTAWWMLHPINVTSVLYVVQRMTSLSATFSLLGLTLYVYFRNKSVDSKSGIVWLRGVFALLICTSISAYCKENGVLTLVYAWLIEVLIFRAQSDDVSYRKIFRLFCWWLPIGAFLLGAGYLLSYPDWLAHGYVGRSFTLEQRLMTESRILWFYIRQLLLPASSLFGLYLDDFSISKGLLQPWTTVVAITAHVAMVSLAIAVRRSLPLVALGIAWFYVGHSVESTVVALELAFEHRNYLPGIGVLLAVVVALDNFFVTRKRQLQRVLVGGLVVLCLTITWQRAVSMADFFGYAVLDAEHHPESSRANFDAGMVLTSAIAMSPGLADELVPRIRLYLERSIQTNKDSLAPFIALLRLSHVIHEPLSDQVIAEFERRLRGGIPQTATGFIARALGERLSETPPLMSHERGEQLYRAALDNPKLTGYSRTVWLAGYAMFVSNIVGDRERGLSIMRQAVDKSPSHGDLHILLAAMMLDRGRLDEADRELHEASQVDPRGYLAGPIQKLRRDVEKKRNEQN